MYKPLSQVPAGQSVCRHMPEGRIIICVCATGVGGISSEIGGRARCCLQRLLPVRIMIGLFSNGMAGTGVTKTDGVAMLSCTCDLWGEKNERKSERFGWAWVVCSE